MAALAGGAGGMCEGQAGKSSSVTSPMSELSLHLSDISVSYAYLFATGDMTSCAEIFFFKYSSLLTVPLKIYKEFSDLLKACCLVMCRC